VTVRWSKILAALSGLVAAGVVLGVGEFVAGLTSDVQSPVDAVGSEFIDQTPRRLKDFAIDNFGTNDKTALRVGMFLVIALLALGLGLWARRTPAVGTVAFLAFGGAGAVIAVQRPDGRLIDAFPPLIGALAGIVVLRVLLSRVPETAPEIEVDEPAVGGGERPERDRIEDARARMMSTNRKGALDRRDFFAASGIAVVAAAAAGGLGRSLRHRFDASASRSAVVLPRPSSAAPVIPAGADLKLGGLSPYITPNRDFYRIDTAFSTPQVNAESWVLRVHGMVDNELVLSYDELLERRVVERTVTLACVSNEVGDDLIGNATWLGVPIADILDEAGVHPGADQLKSTSADGWTCGTPVAALTDGRDALLAFGMNGVPLPVAHGFPVRMVVPGLYGYVSATKWLVDMKLTTFAKYDAYWIDRGWAVEGPVKTQSRIDTPSANARFAAGRVAVAGVAWAQHLGIEAVEVRVDEGPWEQATLATEPTVDAWRQWVWQWDATPGTHVIQVRATDADGETQTERERPPFPDGATGRHTIAVRVD